MINLKKNCLFIWAVIIMISCSKRSEKIGIVFTFDDNTVNEWYAHRALFDKYNIHSTFFISKPHLLDSISIHKLKALESDGHEIACHGYEHKNAIKYPISEYYIEQQVMPGLQKLQEIGFNATSFAYPFGASTPALDSILLHHFKTIRKATYNIQNTTIDQYTDIYANANKFRIVDAMGIDINYDISPENFETGVQRVVKNKEILILHAHTIDTSNEEYTIHPEYLEKLFLICKKYNIKSMTMSEMYDYYQK